MGKMNLSWRSEAACMGMDVNHFYPAQGKPISKMAVQACNGCHVKDKCLEHALLHEEYGYWANTNRIDRRKMRREMGIQLEVINVMENLNETVDKDKEVDNILEEDSKEESYY